MCSRAGRKAVACCRRRVCLAAHTAAAACAAHLVRGVFGAVVGRQVAAVVRIGPVAVNGGVIIAVAGQDQRADVDGHQDVIRRIGDALRLLRGVRNFAGQKETALPAYTRR